VFQFGETQKTFETRKIAEDQKDIGTEPYSKNEMDFKLKLEIRKQNREHDRQSNISSNL